MKKIDDFFDYLEHHPVIMIITVLAAGCMSSLVMASVIAISRPLY